MKFNHWLALVAVSTLSSGALAQSRETVNPNEPLITTFNPVASPAAPLAVLFDNRAAMVSVPGGGSGGLDASRLQNSSLMMTTLGLGASTAGAFRLADDFVVPAAGWTISDITVYGYQTGSTTTSTMNTIRLQIWNGDPSVAGSTVVFGDTTTNRFSSTAFSNIFRDSETSIGNSTRPIMGVTASGLSVNLPAGTYWLDWQIGGTLASGPFVPPITTVGQTTTGNGLQFDGTVWNPANDGGTLTRQGFSFTISGVVNSADVSITKVAQNAGSLNVGSAFSYLLTAANAGPAGATGVVVTDTLPAQVTYVSNTCGATYAAPTLTWTVGALANAANATCTVNVTVASAGAISNTATITSTSSDPNAANNSSTANVAGASLNADVTLTKTAQGTTALNIGSQFTYTLALSNAGPGGATGVVVTDTLPSQVSYVSNNCGATYAAPTLTWTVGALANAGTASCVVTVSVVQAGQISNTAAATSTSVDPTPANNASTATIAGAAPLAVPTNTTLALFALLLGVLGLGMVAVYRR